MIILYYILQFYEMALIASVILSWIRPQGTFFEPLLRFIHAITEPVLSQVRKILPTSQFGLDFSPIIVLILIDLLKRFLVRM